MRVLVACEFSGTVRDAFSARGHDAWSCDILPTEAPGNHIQGDVRGVGFDGRAPAMHLPCQIWRALVGKRPTAKRENDSGA